MSYFILYPPCAISSGMTGASGSVSEYDDDASDIMLCGRPGLLTALGEEDVTLRWISRR